MSLKESSDLALPKGSLVLVTGSTGYIASNIVRELLDNGYKVRGTVRSQEKITKTEKTFNSPSYEAVIVAEMGSEAAFDEAVKGVDAIIHAASPVNFSPNPKEVVGPAIRGAVSILKAAIKEPTIKRFVFTSSSIATTFPKPNKKFKLDQNSWNTEAYEFADFPPPYTEDKAMQVYGASKVKAEEAVWDFVKTENPHFVVNCVLPNYNMGRLVGDGGFTANLIFQVYQGDVNWNFDPQYMIDVVDDARIHISALLDKTVSNQRVFAFAYPFTWNDVLAVFRKTNPSQKYPEDRDCGADLSEPDNEPGAELLRKWWGQSGYKSIEQSLEENIQSGSKN